MITMLGYCNDCKQWYFARAKEAGNKDGTCLRCEKGIPFEELLSDENLIIPVQPMDAAYLVAAESRTGKEAEAFSVMLYVALRDHGISIDDQRLIKERLLSKQSKPGVRGYSVGQIFEEFEKLQAERSGNCD